MLFNVQFEKIFIIFGQYNVQDDDSNQDIRKNKIKNFDPRILRNTNL